MNPAHQTIPQYACLQDTISFSLFKTSQGEENDSGPPKKHGCKSSSEDKIDTVSRCEKSQELEARPKTRSLISVFFFFSLSFGGKAVVICKLHTLIMTTP